MALRKGARHRRRGGSFPPRKPRRPRDAQPDNSSASGGKQRVFGVVQEAFPDARFRVELEDGRKVLAHLAGRLRVRFIRVLPGERVTVELSPYDETRGRIVYRGR